MRAAGPRRARALAAAGLLLASTACSREEPLPIPRERFVAAYVGMVRARIEAGGDTAAYVAARDRALAEAGVTARELEAYVAAGRERPEELRDAWQAVAAKLDTLYGGVTEPPAELGEKLPTGAAPRGGASAADTNRSAVPRRAPTRSRGGRRCSIRG